MTKRPRTISRRTLLAGAGAAASASTMGAQVGIADAAAEMLGPSRPGHFRF